MSSYTPIFVPSTPNKFRKNGLKLHQRKMLGQVQAKNKRAIVNHKTKHDEISRFDQRLQSIRFDGMGNGVMYTTSKVGFALCSDSVHQQMVHPVLKLMVYNFPTLHWGDHETSRSPPTLLDPKNNSNRWFFRLSGRMKCTKPIIALAWQPDTWATATDRREKPT